MLIKGDASTRIRPQDVRLLPCTDHLKEIVYRCIGERRKRYESADEMIEALSTAPVRLNAGSLRSLKGVASGLHRHPEREAQGGDSRRTARRSGGPRRPLHAHERRRARASEPAAGGGTGGRVEADGDQTASGKGTPHHAAQRIAILETRGSRAVMKVGTPKFFATPRSFRRWLEIHHATADELWVGFHKKHTGTRSITWPESVDEGAFLFRLDRRNPQDA